MPGAQSRKLILVVDDQKAVCETLAMILRSKGYVVYTANNGLDALLQLTNMRVDLVISDLDMPRISGFELISAIHWWFPNMPVVAMSGAYDADHVPRDVAFYSKGQGPEGLLEIVEKLLSQHNRGCKKHVRKGRSAA